jgi:hypothetical protein
VSTAVAEKKRKLSRVEELSEALEKHKAERQRLETELADLALSHQAALDEALAKEPGVNPYRVGTAPFKKRERQARSRRSCGRSSP